MICLSVVSHGQVDIAEDLLRSIARLRPPALSHIVYTRNLPEREPAASIVSELGPIRFTLIDNPAPKGFGANHNAAFAHCREKYFAVVNPDIVLGEADPFEPLLAPFRDPDMGLTAPVVTDPGGRIENTARTLYTPVELLRQKLSPGNRGAAAHWMAGMFLLFRGEAFRAIGGFDPGYFLYIEDVDICTRLRLAGWQLRQVPQARVVHHARKQSHRSLRYARWHISGMLRYWRSPGFWAYRRLLREDAASRADR